RAAECHLAVLDLDADIARIDVRIIGEPFANELSQQLVAALVAFRSVTAVRDLEQLFVCASRVELSARRAPLHAAHLPRRCAFARMLEAGVRARAGAQELIATPHSTGRGFVLTVSRHGYSSMRIVAERRATRGL